MITVTADTNDLVACSGGVVFNVDSLSADVLISGFDNATILSATGVFDNTARGVLGFGEATCAGNDYLDMRNDAFTTYDLATSIGPILDPSRLLGDFMTCPRRVELWRCNP